MFPVDVETSTLVARLETETARAGCLTSRLQQLLVKTVCLSRLHGCLRVWTAAAARSRYLAVVEKDAGADVKPLIEAHMKAETRKWLLPLARKTTFGSTYAKWVNRVTALDDDATSEADEVPAPAESTLMLV